MKIISVPHPNLRQTAQAVTQVDEQLTKFVTQLANTLLASSQPKGVGLAAPQVNSLHRLFAINTGALATTEQADQIDIFINPVITKHAPQLSFGQDDAQPTLEGCLSIPKLYGPVPRWPWIILEYDQLKAHRLERKKIRLEWFAARVAQHELDHLDGKLFTDYSLAYDLPVYQENKSGKLIELENRNGLNKLSNNPSS